MKTIGIIAEFNPFHNGHRHLLGEAKRLTGADYAVVVMSGDFVQRGAPALCKKYARAHMALLNGADLVVELPVVYATGSAEYFACGAVRLLDQLGVVDCLCFGSECGDIEMLKNAAASLAEESPAYRAVLQESLKQGHSFPTARAKAVDHISQSAPAPAVSPTEPHTVDSLGQSNLALPNNILGLEYIRALDHFHSQIEPITIARQGSDYHDENITDGFCSATALRKVLLDARGCGSLPPQVAAHVPENTLSLYAGLLPSVLGEDDFSDLLHYKLLQEVNGRLTAVAKQTHPAPTERENNFIRYQDITADLSAKISKNIPRFTGYSDFIALLKSKDLTYTRLSRCLCHILLDIYSADVARYVKRGYVSYARVLGFRAEAAPLLRQIKKRAEIPLITKLAGARRVLDGESLQMLDKDIQAAHVYNIMARFPTTEYTTKIGRV
jgi:predicted nucleotidyltransferase